MTAISDNIENIIREMLDSNGGYVRIVRNELAGKLNCVPSQINYVLTTRFSAEQGYYIESRRGGSGGIRIIRYRTGSVPEYINRLIDSIGESLTETRADMLMKGLVSKGYLGSREASLLRSSFSDKALSGLSADQKQAVRSGMFRQMLSCLLTEKKKGSDE